MENSEYKQCSENDEQESMHASVHQHCVFTCGNGVYGRLGHGDEITYPAFGLVEHFSFNKIHIVKVAITAASHHAVSSHAQGGRVYSWGKNHLGQLGIGTTWNEEFLPKLIEFDSEDHPFTGITDIWTGESHVFVRKESDKTSYGWGSGLFGLLGFGNDEERRSPKRIEPIEVDFVHFAGGSMHSLAIDSEGNVWTSGKNREKQLGYEASSRKFQKVQALMNRNAKAISAACGKDNNVVVDSQGRVWIWGAAREGTLGQIDTSLTLISPSLVHLPEGSPKFRVVKGGDHHFLLLSESGELYGFGTNYLAQLSGQDRGITHHPAKLYLIEEALKRDDERLVSFGCGFDHSFLLTENGRLYTWGHNWYGKTGHDTRTSGEYIYEPTVVKDLQFLKIEACAAGNMSMMVVGRPTSKEVDLPLRNPTEKKVNQSFWTYIINDKYHPTQAELEEIDRKKHPEKYNNVVAAAPPPPAPTPPTPPRKR